MIYYFLIIFTQFTDWLTTYLGITKYHSAEGNPFVANIINNYGFTYLLLFKLLVGILITYMWREVKPLGWLVIIYFAGISIHNLALFH